MDSFRNTCTCTLSCIFIFYILFSSTNFCLVLLYKLDFCFTFIVIHICSLLDTWCRYKVSEWKVQQWSNIRFRLLYVVELDCDDCWITMATMHCPAGSTPRVGGDQGWSLFVHAITHHNHSYHYKHYIASNFHGRESNQTVIGFDKHYFLQHLIYVCKSSINIEQKVFA